MVQGKLQKLNIFIWVASILGDIAKDALIKCSKFDANFIGLQGKKIMIFGYHQPKTATVLVTGVNRK